MRLSVYLFLSIWTMCLAVVPSGQLNIRYSYTTVDFSVASFGGALAQVGYSPYYKLVTPSSDAKGCDTITVPSAARSSSKGYILVIERGDCSFYSKAKNAQDAGASAVLIYNSLEGIYLSKSYAPPKDYDCSNGQAWAPASVTSGLTSATIFGSDMTSAIPQSCGNSGGCDSGVCLYTNNTNRAGDRETCCAWDLYLSMGTTENGEPDLNIPVGFIRMEDHDKLSSYSSFSLNLMEVLVYEKADFWNWSSFALWALAVFTIIYGAISAAEEDKIFIHTGGGKQASNKGHEAMEEDDESVSSNVSLRRVRRHRVYGSSGGNSGSKYSSRAVTERTGLLSPDAARADGGDDDMDKDGDDLHLSGEALVGSPPRDGSDKNSAGTSNWGGGKAVSWFGFFGDDTGSLGNVPSAALAPSSSVDNDEMTVGSLRSEASAFFFRVKGHLVHTSEHMMDDLGDGPSVPLGPLHVLLFLVVSSGLLLTLYFVDLDTYISLFYMVAAAYCLHSRALLPLLEWGRDTAYKWAFLYDYRNLGQDCSLWWEECCMDAGCVDGVPYRLPQMEIDDEEAIYDEETGAVVTESALNHSSRFYVRPLGPQQGMRRGGRSGGGSFVASSRDYNTSGTSSSSSIRSAGSLTCDDSAGSVGMATADSDLSINRGSGTLASCAGSCVACCANSPQTTKVVLTVASLVMAVLTAVCWYLYPTSSFRWFLQDALGVSVCVFLLGSVQVPNLKIASILLGCAFVYDIFFTMISPLIFGDSVMLSVASGSAEADSSSALADDENYCEKYPDDDACATSTLPMLLYIPAFWTWDSDNDAMLGLGDIVLPGLLLVWAARYDLRRYGSLYTEKAGNGYFPMVAAGYAIGLCLAEITVELTSSGQPALMFIIPCTLGPALARATNSGTLPDLWEALPPMKSIGLLLNEQEEAGDTGIIRTTAMWPWDRERGGDRDGGGDGDGAGAGAPDDQSVHSLHGYNLDSARRVDAASRQAGYSKGFFF